MTPKQRSVTFTTTVLLPILCSAVECRVKNKFCLLLTKIYLRRKRPPRNCFCATAAAEKQSTNLFNFDFRTRSLNLFLDFVCFLLCHAFLDCFGGSFHKRFGLRQA